MHGCYENQTQLPCDQYANVMTARPFLSREKNRTPIHAPFNHSCLIIQKMHLWYICTYRRKKHTYKNECQQKISRGTECQAMWYIQVNLFTFTFHGFLSTPRQLFTANTGCQLFGWIAIQSWCIHPLIGLLYTPRAITIPAFTQGQASPLCAASPLCPALLTLVNKFGFYSCILATHPHI